MTRVRLAGAAALALALAGLALWLTLDDPREQVTGLRISVAIAAGLSFVASGLLAMWRRPENRVGVLLAAVGYLWFLGALSESENGWVHAFGYAFGSVAFGAFVHLLLSYPTGRLRGRFDRLLVGATYALVVGGGLLVVLLDRTPMPDCPECPESPIALTDGGTPVEIVNVAVSILGVAIAASLVVVLVRRWRDASPAQRRLLAPIFVSGVAALATIGVTVAVAPINSELSQAIGWAFLVALCAVPVAFLLGVLRSRLARVAVGGLVLELGDGQGGSGLREALARALHDPTLELAFPVGDGHVDSEGRPYELPTDRAVRAATPVEREGRPVAVLVHDPSLDEEPELLREVAAAAALALDNERLRAELRSQYEFLDTIVNTAPSLLVFVGTDGRIRNLNLAVERASGVDDPELIRGRPFWEVFADPDDRPALQERFAEAAPDFAPGEYESAFTNARGEQVVVAWSAVPLRDSDGDVTGIVAGGLDITDRKRRELELQGERDFLDTVGNTIPSLLVLVDREARVLPDGVNRAFIETFRRPTAEAGKRIFFEFVHPEDEYAARMAIGAAANGVARTDLESRWLASDGEERLISWTATPISHPVGGDLVLITGVDVTERREQEDEIRASRARLVAAGDAERRRLERNLHDGAQQRLVSLSLALRLVQARLAGDPDAAAELLESAREELGHAIDELRELARGIHPAVLTERGLAAALDGLAGRVPLPVEVEAPETRLPGPIEAAAYYVVAESLTNVVRYADATGAHVRVVEGEETVVVEVVDDGRGGADPAAGSGLRGLADRVAALDGSLEVESPAGAGTRVRAVLPVRSAVPSK